MQDLIGSETSELERVFDALVEAWRHETAALASVHQQAIHPAYQRIIGLGPAAVPLLLRELRDRPEHWFWALNAITGEDPAVATTRFEDAVHAWLDWGRSRGYLD